MTGVVVTCFGCSIVFGLRAGLAGDDRVDGVKTSTDFDFFRADFDIVRNKGLVSGALLAEGVFLFEGERPSLFVAFLGLALRPMLLASSNSWFMGASRTSVAAAILSASVGAAGAVDTLGAGFFLVPLGTLGTVYDLVGG